MPTRGQPTRWRDHFSFDGEGEGGAYLRFCTLLQMNSSSLNTVNSLSCPVRMSSFFCVASMADVQCTPSDTINR
jgi:hypothetical protein